MYFITIVSIFTTIVLAMGSIGLLYNYLILVAAVFAKAKAGQETRSNFNFNTFAILIPAHNESEVIPYLLDSIYRGTYPKSYYRVFVIADNCADSTAEVSRLKGATALERTDTLRKGKPYAIGWALQTLDSMGFQYEAVIIFDADNVVSPNFLDKVNESLNAGACAFQGSVESKNLMDSWVTVGNYISYSAINRIFQQGRHVLGLGAHLCGTGMGFSRSLLDIVRWDQGSLTEDREFTNKLLLKNIKTAWLNDAILFDEKPVGTVQSINQQSRWINGWGMDIYQFAPQMIKAFLRERKITYLDALFNLFKPFFSVRGIELVPLLLFVSSFSLWIWWLTLNLLLLAYYGIGLSMNNARKKIYPFIFMMPFFKLLSLLSYLKATFSHEGKAWIHTKHTRRICYDEIQK